MFWGNPLSLFLGNKYLCSVILNSTTMKKVLLFGICALLLMSSCGTYEASGAATGAHFGSMIGSAIGGITGGWRGSDVGQLVGMAGGAVVGAAIGRAADQKVEERAEQRYQQHKQRYLESRDQQADRYNYGSTDYQGYDDSGFDPSNSGDDRISFDGAGPADGAGISAPTARISPTAAPQQLEIRNARLIEDFKDGVLRRGEQAKVTFEIYNPASYPVYNVQPAVGEITGNRHVHVSENILVESIGPRRAIRYTATVKADPMLRNGQAVIRIGVFQDNKVVPGQSRTFTLQTSKR